MKKATLLFGLILWAGLWSWSCLSGVKGDLHPAKAPGPTRPTGSSAPTAPENLTGTIKTATSKFASRAQVEEAIAQAQIQIGGIGQELVLLETYLYLMRDGLMKEKRVGALAQIRWEYGYNPIINIEAVQVRLDEELVVDRQDKEDRLDRQKELDLFQAAVVPGEHQVTALVSVRGRKRGWFNYFQKYQIELKLTRKLSFPEGKISLVSLSLLDRGGRFELSERLKLDLRLETREVGSRP
jgi:hypothetical protein